MIELSTDFNSLSPEYRDVLRLAQEKNHIEVTPLQELGGGATGAVLFLVSISKSQSGPVEHLILKLDHKSKKPGLDELERHRLALNEAPSEFARNHIADLAFEQVEHEDTVAIFYSIAGQSLHNFRPLASYQQQNRLEKIFSMTNHFLLAEWNATSEFNKAVHPRALLSQWLGYRLKDGGNIERFLKDICHIHQNTTGLLIQDQAFPNPLPFARQDTLWGKIRPIDVLRGFQHGDLNIGNILVQFNEENTQLTGYYLIDFALFKTGTALLYDQRYLEMSYLIRELSRAPFSKWVNLVVRFALQDTPDPREVPIELAGTCAVINAGRKAFSEWVRVTHPSLSDDLWGQFWLAAVAAGLNYCNKTIIPAKERLAGLIFAAAHLKRYHSRFGVPLPADIKALDLGWIGEVKGTIPPGKTVAAVSRYNLPVQPTPFIGRQKELTTVHHLMEREDTRLLTLTGPGGTGKTRLALQVAKELIDVFKDGIYFVDLSAVHKPENVPVTIARTIGLSETSDQDLLKKLKEQLQDQNLLLLLDNFEQVTSAAPLVGQILGDCPHLKFLVSSREALRLQGEQIFPVPPLQLPASEGKHLSAEEITGYESVRLFIERAKAVKPDFELSSRNAAEVCEICMRLDGLPLPIELAAARISLFSSKDLLERLGNRLKLLRGGARDLPDRQKTMYNTIDWSYELLNPEEQRLFTLLSVFSGCNFKAVEQVINNVRKPDEPEIDLLEGLASLVDKNLIIKAEPEFGESRLLMLQTIREFAAERLAEDPEFSANVRREHAGYFADFSHHQWERLTGDKREEALQALETDIENLRTAWHYWVKAKDLEQLRKLTDCLWLLNDLRGWYQATVDLMADLLKVLESTPSEPEHSLQEIMLQTSLARVLMVVKGYSPEIEQAYNRALELCREHGKIPQSFPILRALGSYYGYSADFEKGTMMGEQILSLAEHIADPRISLEGHLIKGYNLAFMSSLKQGLDHLEQGLSFYDPDRHSLHRFQLGNNPGVSCLTTSALILWMLGYPDQALQRAEEALTLTNRLNHPFSRAYALFHTGLLHLWRREAELVQHRALQVLDISAKYDFKIWEIVATCLAGIARAEIGNAEEGLMQIQEGTKLYHGLKTNPPVFWPLLLFFQAQASGRARKYREGVALLDEALEIMGKTSGNPMRAEFFRLKGDLLLLQFPEKSNEAEKWFNRALESARKREARMPELRAVMSLCRLWYKQNLNKKAQQLLNSTYGKFTEGFTTVDLSEAKKLLEEVS
jgi:predicted ATPase